MLELMRMYGCPRVGVTGLFARREIRERSLERAWEGGLQGVWSTPSGFGVWSCWHLTHLTRQLTPCNLSILCFWLDQP